MKKKIFILLLVFSFSLFTNISITNAADDTCGDRDAAKCDSSIYGLDKDNHVCYPVNSKCSVVTKTCSQRKKSECDSNVYGLDRYGNQCQYVDSQCEIVKRGCDTKKHCTCYTASSCPETDDYGNTCVDLPESKTCIVKKPKTSVDGDDSEGYNNYEEKGDVTCGNGLTFNKSIANITHFMVLLFQIITPSILVILGMIDFFKAISSGKDEDLKKAGSTFGKRLTVAALMFLIIMIVRIVINLFSNQTIMDCFNCFVNGANKC